MALLHVFEPRRQLFASVDGVQLIGNQQDRYIGFEQSQDFGVGRVEHACFHHKQHQIDIAHRTQYCFVQRLVKRRVVAGLKAWCVNKHILSRAFCANARNAVTCGLRFARRDADFLAHQRIEQSRFTHIGLADNGDQTATLGGVGFCVHPRALTFKISSMAAAAACSPARREGPLPCCERLSSGMSQATSKICRCAAPDVATTEY